MHGSRKGLELAKSRKTGVRTSCRLERLGRILAPGGTGGTVWDAEEAEPAVEGPERRKAMMFRLKGNFSGTRSDGPNLPIAGARRWVPPLQEEVRTPVTVLGTVLLVNVALSWLCDLGALPFFRCRHWICLAKQARITGQSSNENRYGTQKSRPVCVWTTLKGRTCWRRSGTVGEHEVVKSWVMTRRITAGQERGTEPTPRTCRVLGLLSPGTAPPPQRRDIVRSYRSIRQFEPSNRSIFWGLSALK